METLEDYASVPIFRSDGRPYDKKELPRMKSLRRGEVVSNEDILQLTLEQTQEVENLTPAGSPQISLAWRERRGPTPGISLRILSGPEETGGRCRWPQLGGRRSLRTEQP
jgi:hypothetical protein